MTQSKDPDTHHVTSTARTFLTPKHVAKLGSRCALCVIAFAFLIPTTAAHAQGCAQCLDSTRTTPPAVQAAYRHAIYLLAGAAITFFAAGTLFLRRRP